MSLENAMAAYLTLILLSVQLIRLCVTKEYLISIIEWLVSHSVGNTYQKYSHFKTWINCLFLKEYAPFIAKFLIAIEVRFVKRGSPPAIRWTVSRTCSDLSCRMITSPSNWSISPRSLDWTTKVYCSLTLKNINLYCYQSFHFFLNSLIFFLPLSIKQSGVWSALMSSTDCPAWFGNQRRGCLLLHFFCKHRTSLEKNKENKKKIG